jgi:hypothetical protein
MATVWPTAHTQVGVARQWLVDSGAKILHEESVYVRPEVCSVHVHIRIYVMYLHVTLYMCVCVCVCV